MKTHIERVHERKKSFNCEKCEKIFSSKGKLKQHIASVNEGDKPFQCQKSFESKKGFISMHTFLFMRKRYDKTTGQDAVWTDRRED